MGSDHARALDATIATRNPCARGPPDGLPNSGGVRLQQWPATPGKPQRPFATPGRSMKIKYGFQELGVDALLADVPVSAEKQTVPQRVEREVRNLDERPETNEPFERPKITRPEPVVKRPASRLSSLPSLKTRSAVKPDIGEIAKSVRSNEAEPMKATAPVALSIMNETTDTIESIRAEIGDCTRCPLHVGRKQIVHTTGNFQADLMFVGEAPGADEDEQGFPFVGRAGRLLTDIIKAMGFERESVCIGNINRCRPPENRKPEPVETATCRPFLMREIAVVKPKVIVVLGATAAHNLLQVKTPITKMRGEFHDYFGVKVMPTFHPAYLLRDPHKKKDVWEDMKKVLDFLAN